MGDKEGLLCLLPCVQNCLQFTLLVRNETNPNVFMNLAGKMIFGGSKIVPGFLINIFSTFLNLCKVNYAF